LVSTLDIVQESKPMHTLKTITSNDRILNELLHEYDKEFI
jgi:hypothetical protein